ncbi:hypothetical protein D6D01_05180 [Aureobasidium pullulans]|uniref:Uncharacterized protein n=1 Tax=Aureobasidium pullulans TaxID=5580 RepID=A0A4S9L7D9_AURPU|nr:hypothetical protein D6D01_05180 [Aureobasidium pullulans]
MRRASSSIYILRLESSLWLSKVMIRAPSSGMSLTQTEVQLISRGLRETANLIRLIVSPRVTGSKRCSDASRL